MQCIVGLFRDVCIGETMSYSEFKVLFYLKNDGCFRLLNEKVMDENKKKSPMSSM